MIAIQVSLYPIGEKDIKKSLDNFWNVLREENINYKVTPLSTITWSDDEDKLYRAIYKAYKKARKISPVVMVMTLTTGDKERIGELLDYLQ
ncbi:MAG: hypothetical protein PHQ09_03620 [Actinomycetota bacterium]|nr:hypothetical protein [Actinomycetota bacterium]